MTDQAVAVLRNWSSPQMHDSGTRLYLYCPGCDDLHAVEVSPDAKGASWSFDGNLSSPTISPSIKVEGVQWEQGAGFYKPTHHSVPAGGQVICHSFVKHGHWVFLDDCTHDMKGQTVPLPPLPAHIIPNECENVT